MKDEEFNNILRKHAESFEMKPSSGSFDAVVSKMQNKRKKRIVYILLPFVFAVAVGAFIANLLPTNQIVTVKDSSKTPVQVSPQQIVENQKQLPAEQLQNKNTTEIASNEALIKSEPIPALVKVKDNFYTQKATIPTSPLPIEDNVIENYENSINNAITQGQTIAPVDVQPAQAVTNAPNTPALVDNAPIAITNTLPLTNVAATSAHLINTSVKPPKKGCNCGNSKWSAQMYFTPLIFSGVKEEAQSQETQNSNFNGRISQPYTVKNSLQDFGNGNGIGLGAEYAFAKRWQIGLGIQYSRWYAHHHNWSTHHIPDSVEKYLIDPITAVPTFAGYEDITHTNVIDSAVSRFNITSIQIPVWTRFNAYNGKNLQIGIRAGFVLDYKRREENTIIFINSIMSNQVSFDKSTLSNNYTNFNVALNTGFDISYRVGKCLALYTSPQITIPFKNINQSSQTIQRPIILGLQTGFRFHF